MTEQSQLGPSRDGTVVLDIGGDIGALVLHCGHELHLAEIEISRVDGGPVPGGYHRHGHEHPHDHARPHDHPHGHEHGPDDAPRTHVAVRERRGPGGVRYAAIYPGLPQGEYTVWGLDGAPAEVVSVVGGTITEIDWR